MKHKKLQQADLQADWVRDALNRVLGNRRFKASRKLGELLTVIVETALAGEAGRLSAYALGVEVFGRPADFDAEFDSIVRVSANRLRRLLEDYYQDEGQNDPVRIVLPKGRYAPEFVSEAAASTRLSPGRGPILLVVERLEWNGPGPDTLNLAVGLTHELVTALNGWGDTLTAVQAQEHSDTDGFAGGPARPPGILYYLRGNLQCQQEDQIRLGVMLVEAADGTVAWSEKLTRRLSSANLFAIQEEVARNVAAKLLDLHVGLYRSLKRKPAVLLGTYLALFRYSEYQEHFSAESHLRAREALVQVVEQEPGYADAWAALSNVYLGEALFGYNPARPLPALIDLCVETALRAVALDPRSAMANYILAMTLFYRRDKARFLAAAENALGLAPHKPDNLATVGMHLAMAGDWKRGVALVEEAVRLNPFHPPWYHLVFSLHHLNFRRFAEALAAIGRFSSVDFFPLQINLAVIHGHLGHRSEAAEAQRRMFVLWPEARERMDAILDLWFPCEDLAEVFAEGLAKAGFTFDWPAG
jgi:adenylate cyclase